MDDYQKLFNDISNQNIKAAELERRKKTVIKTVSIITIVLLQPSP